MEAQRTYDWTVTPEKVESAVRRIIEAAKPLRIILFGSYMRKTAGADSDLDILVITGDDVDNPRKESVRLRRSLRGISMPMDILVVPRSQWEQLKDRPGLIYREAARAGRLVYESSP
ncbi:MAG TPA: nucleotidyltransferase domain-containing protein [bacterium]|nr:nucleotidyltransferase domain-containing protein [bacterium]